MRITPAKFLLLICFAVMNAIMPEILSAQKFSVRNFTTRDGLAHNDVRAVSLDSLGFLWIATWDGLSRYDGYTFKNYFHDPDDSLSLPYFSIHDVKVDGGNNLWLLTDQWTIALYDRSEDNFKMIGSLYDSLPEHFSGLIVDEAGFAWFPETNKLYRFDFKNNRFDIYEIQDKETPIKFKIDCSVSVYQDKIFMADISVVAEFDRLPGNKLILRHEYPIDSKYPKIVDFNFAVWLRIYISETGRKWIFSNYGLFLLDDKSGIFREYRGPFPGHEFIGDGILAWAWFDDGIYVYNMKESGLSHVPGDISQLCRSIFFQEDNLMWFSDKSGTGASLGLNRVVFTPDYFKDYPVPSASNDLPSVYAVTRDKNNDIWVGIRSDNPLVRIQNNLKATQIKIPGHFYSPDNGAIRSLNATSEGVWVGFSRQLLLFYSYKTGKFKRFSPESLNFRALAIDKNGDLYLGGAAEKNDLVLYSPVLDKTIEKYPFSHPSPIYKLLIDSAGIVWGGLNWSNLLRFDPATKRIECLPLSNGTYNIEDICQGDHGDLWLAFLGGGVCNFDPVTGRKKFYNTSDGLANNTTYSLLKDKSGFIWVSTNTGLSRINPITGKIRNFGPDEGLNIIEFNSGASLADSSGEFFMGGMGGLVGFYPDTINIRETETGVQKVIITEISVSGKPVNYNITSSGIDTIVLNRGENNIKISFSSSDFINSGKTVYRYRLSGVNDIWVESDSRNRNISYVNLKPGWHDFQVQATDRAGFWSLPRVLKLKIQPYYYQTHFFRIAVPSGLLLLIVGMVFIYIRQLKQREAHKQATLRLQSLRGQMNPHFIFNSLNSINYFISNNDKLSANRYIADFSKLIRSILQNMNSDYISLDKEIESVVNYLEIEYLRFGDKFEYEVHVDKELDDNSLKVSPGMIQPFVENAIWHGVRGLESRKGRIEVWFSFNTGHLTCTITDDGIGRRRTEMLKTDSDQKKSRGILLVQERLRIINGLQGSRYKIDIRDLHPDMYDTGTIVEIEIPINRSSSRH